MKLDLKKKLAAKTLKVGVGRVILNEDRLADIKEAITKQDIRDLVANGAISVREVKGRKTNVKRKTRRRIGKIKIKVNKRKQEYVRMTRKLRDYIKKMKEQEVVDNEKYKDVRKKIRNRVYKSKRHLKEQLE